MHTVTSFHASNLTDSLSSLWGKLFQAKQDSTIVCLIVLQGPSESTWLCKFPKMMSPLIAYTSSNNILSLVFGLTFVRFEFLLSCYIGASPFVLLCSLSGHYVIHKLLPAFTSTVPDQAATILLEHKLFVLQQNKLFVLQQNCSLVLRTQTLLRKKV